MTISRRQFLLATSGAVAGFILPSYYEKVLEFTERFGKPLIAVPKNPKIVLTAVDWAGDGAYELNWGKPEEEPDLNITLREYAIRYCGGEQGYLDMYGEEREWVDFDEIAFGPMVYGNWERIVSPQARASLLLEKFDLGSKLTRGNSVGELDFIDCPNPSSCYLGVHAMGLVSISLLQQRLNDLRTGISVKMA